MFILLLLLLLFFFFTLRFSSISNELYVTKDGKTDGVREGVNFSNKGAEYNWIHCVGSHCVTIKGPEVWVRNLWARIAEWVNEVAKLSNVSVIRRAVSQIYADTV